MRSPLAAAVAVIVGHVAYLQIADRIEVARASAGSDSVVRFRAIQWEIDGWRSQALPIRSDLNQPLGADAVVRREYASGQDRIEVWINHYTNSAKGVTHSPEVCMGLDGWRWSSGHTRRSRTPDEVAMSVERFSRGDTMMLIASTFVVGERFYATQPAAKLALARHGGPVVFATASAADPENSPALATLTQRLLEQVARRATSAVSAPSMP